MPPQVQEQRPQPQQPKVAIDPFEQPVDYLKAHGYKPLGNPEWSSTLWIDATKPIWGEQHYEPKFANFLRRDQATGKVGYVQEQVMANDGFGKQVPVQQLTITPPATPITMQAALQLVMEREHRKQMEAERAKSKVA